MIKKEIVKQHGAKSLKILNKSYRKFHTLYGLFVFSKTKKGHDYYSKFITDKCDEYYSKYQR